MVDGDPGQVLPVVYGNIETTGAWAEDCIDAGVFDWLIGPCLVGFDIHVRMRLVWSR